jgi:hypothetical protein
VIGGVLGLLFIPVMVFLGAFSEAFSGGTTTLYAQAAVSALISIIGLVAAVLVKGRPRAWGICLVLCGIIGFVVASGFYVGGLLLLVAGILALVRKDPQGSEDSEAYSKLEQQIQTARTGKAGAQRLLAYGAYTLDERTINSKVTRVSPGAYALGAAKENAFYVQLVGRSDTDVGGELKKHSGEYDLFKFEYFDAPERAFSKECELYHAYNQPEGRLANRQHPQRPEGTTWQCPKCNFAVLQTTTVVQSMQSEVELASQAVALNKTKVCPHCDAQTREGDQYCSTCGQRIEERSAPQIEKTHASSAPPAREIDVWVPVVWLCGILITGIAFGLFALVLLVAAAVYVHYNSKKFGIGGDRAILTAIIAIIGLPLYANDLHKLRQMQMRRISQG